MGFWGVKTGVFLVILAQLWTETGCILTEMTENVLILAHFLDLLRKVLKTALLDNPVAF